MTAAHPRPIKSWISRQSSLSINEKSLLHAAEQRGIFYPLGSRLPGLADAIAAAPRTYLDIGFGDGQSLLQLAEFDPEALIIGVEPHMPGVLRVLRSEPRAQVRIAACDVYDVFPALPKSCLDRVHVYFSDPWPKTRHHKRRLIQKNFWDTLAPFLSEQALVHIATDWAPYAEMIAEELSSLPLWVSDSTDPLPVEKQFVRQKTKYERKAAKEGRFVTEFYVKKNNK